MDARSSSAFWIREFLVEDLPRWSGGTRCVGDMLPDGADAVESLLAGSRRVGEVKDGGRPLSSGFLGNAGCPAEVSTGRLGD